MGTSARELLIHSTFFLFDKPLCLTALTVARQIGGDGREQGVGGNEQTGRACSIVTLIEPRRHRDGTKIVSGLSDMFSPAAGDASAARRHDGQLSESGRVAADFSACHSPN